MYHNAYGPCELLGQCTRNRLQLEEYVGLGDHSHLLLAQHSLAIFVVLCCIALACAAPLVSAIR